MLKIGTALILLLITTPAIAAKSDVWTIEVHQIHRSSNGDNIAEITLTLDSCSGSSLMNVNVCGFTPNGNQYCRKVEGGRMSQGSEWRGKVYLGRTSFPLEGVRVGQ
jgi:hypothetical protein